ncbi:WASH complex subunit 2 [Anopheles bellator]|uniref:WASH complex subunit 2 n=1 Tax=Anopheles bellator TaxID=139047 RepID=UPI00264A1FC7|nr:WASH complex subunit 2 [Anopheles bellator]
MSLLCLKFASKCNAYVHKANTPDDLRQRIPNWSLESDGQLLQYMISIAKNLEEKCTKTRDSLNSLMVQVDQTEVKLAHTTNQLSAVEQVKFVENRVEEDDESFYGLRRRRQVDVNREKATHSDSERSLDDMIQLAVDRSIEGMYDCYEKVTLKLDSDSSDDDDQEPQRGQSVDPVIGGGKPSVMRAIPRYSFIERPLPHVIGSKEWHSKWHVGLIDSEDESNSDRKEEYSESSSDTDGMFPSQPNSKNHTPSESESSIWGTEARKRTHSMDPSNDEGSSVYSYGSSSKPQLFPVPQRAPVNVAPIATNRLKPPGLFPEEPPEEEPSENARKPVEKGLFDDSPAEEDDMLPTPVPKTSQAQVGANRDLFFRPPAQPTRKTVNLFDDEPPPVTNQEQPYIAEQKRSINLFVESEDESESVENMRNNNTSDRKLISDLPPEQVNDRHRITSKLGSSSVLSSQADPRAKLVDELNNNFQKQQQPVPIGRETVTVTPREQRSNLFDDEHPEDQFDKLFANSTAAVQPAPRKQPEQPTPASRSKDSTRKPVVNLFADDNDSDDDAIVVGSSEKQTPNIARSASLMSPNRLTLSTVTSDRVTIKKKSIFDESDSEGDDAMLFGQNSKPPSMNTNTKDSSKIPSSAVPVEVIKKPAKSIFSDSSEEEDDDDSLFGNSSNIVKNKLDALKRGNGSDGTSASSKPNEPIQGLEAVPKRESIVQDKSSNDDDRLFGAEMDRNLGTIAPLAASQKSVLQTSLFDDQPPSDDDDGGLFGSGRTSIAGITAKLTSVKVSNGPKPHSETASSAAVADLNKTIESTTAITENTAEKADIIQSNDGATNNDSTNPFSERRADPLAGTSVRNMIMKKAIFHSDSESDEQNESLFGSESENAILPTVPSSQSVADSAIDCDTTATAQGVSAENRIRIINSEETQSSKENLLNAPRLTSAEEPKKNTPEDSAAEGLTSTNSEPNDAEQNTDALNGKTSVSSTVVNDIVLLHDSNEPKATVLKTSLFEASSEEERSDIEERAKGNHDEVGHVKSKAKQLEASPSNHKQVTEHENVSPISSSLVDPVADGAKFPTQGHSQEPSTLDADENPSPLMIANDIDYYLRTNELPVSEPRDASNVSDEPTTPPPSAPAKSEPKRALNFSPIGLFDDLPPPDDMDGLEQNEKHFTSATGNESSLSVEDVPTYGESQSMDYTPNGSSASQQRYMFDNEPPPDDVDNYRTTGASARQLFEGKLTSNDFSVSLPPFPSVREPEKAARPKVNKLNSKLSINVAALLPGARRLPVTSKENATDSSSLPERDEKNQTDLSSAAGSSSNSAPEKLLVNLNKGRARIPAKRKPPSRSNLRVGNSSDEAKDTHSDDARIVVGSEGKIEHIEAAFPAAETVRNEFENIKAQREPSPDVTIKPAEPAMDRLRASARNTVTKTVLPVGNETSVSKSTTTRQTEVSVVSKSIFGDSEDDEDEADDLFSKLPSKAPLSVASKARLSQAVTGTENTRSIFGSDDDAGCDVDEDDLFGTKKSSKSGSTIVGQLKSAVTSNVLKPSKGTKSLFGDDGSDADDDDDLFSSKPNASIPKASDRTVQSNKFDGKPATTASTTRTVTKRTSIDPLADLLDS